MNAEAWYHLAEKTWVLSSEVVFGLIVGRDRWS
jgi:hypothetical protein